MFKYSYDVLVKLGIAQFRWGYNDALNSTTYYASMSCCINSYINNIIPNNDDRCWSNELSISCTKYFDFFRIFDGLYRKGDFILYNIHMDDEDCIISVLNSVSGIFEKCYVYGWGLGYETHMRDLLNYLNSWFKNKPIKAICVIGDGVSRCRLFKHNDGEVSVVVY